MFNNPFLKKDPLLEAVKNAQADGECRRQAEKIVNEEFGVYSRKAVVREHLSAYDAALEEVYTALKEGKNSGLAALGKPTNKITRKDVLIGRGVIPSDVKEGNVTLNDVRDADAAKNPSGYAAQRNKSEDQALERAGKGLAKDINEKKMWEGSPLDPKDSDVTAASKTITKSSGEDPSTPKVPYSQLPKPGNRAGSVIDSAKGAAGMNEETLDELTKPTAKTAMKAYYRAYDSDVRSGEGERSSRLGRWKQKNLPGKSARNQKDTGKAELPDYSEKDSGYVPTVKKSGKLMKSTEKATKTEIKSRLGKHTQPKHLPEETLDEATRKHFKAHAADIAKISDQEERNKAATSAANTYARLNPRFDHAKFHAAAGSTAHQQGKVNEERWIQAALKKKTKGALHKDLGVSTKKKIPLSKLKSASDDPGKTGKRARLALTLRKLHEKLESDSFKAAQVTGKSVSEDTAATAPSWVNQPAPGVQRAAAKAGSQRLQGSTFYRGMKATTSGQGSAKFLPQTSARATGPAPKTGTSLVPSGNRLPTATASGGMTKTSSTGGMTKPAATSGSGFSYSRGPSTPGVNPPHPSEKIGGFGSFKPASSGGGLSAISKGIGSAVAKVARFAANPVVGGIAAAMDPTPANQGENEFARQAKYGQKKPAEAPKPAAAPAAAPAPKAATPVKQSFKQAYSAARQAATAAKQDPNKAQFNWTNKAGKEGTYQAASTKKDYVPAAKQFKTNISAPASSEPQTSTAPLPPARPKNLTPTSASGDTTVKTSPAANSEKIATQIASSKFGSPESVATSVKASKPASSSGESMNPEKTPGASFTPATPAPDAKAAFGSSSDLAKDIAKAQEPKKAPVIRGPMQESVQVGNNKYRII